MCANVVYIKLREENISCGLHYINVCCNLKSLTVPRSYSRCYTWSSLLLLLISILRKGWWDTVPYSFNSTTSYVNSIDSPFLSIPLFECSTVHFVIAFLRFITSNFRVPSAYFILYCLTFLVYYDALGLVMGYLRE